MSTDSRESHGYNSRPIGLSRRSIGSSATTNLANKSAAEILEIYTVQELTLDKPGTARLLGKIGLAYQKEGNGAEAREYFNKLLQLGLAPMEASKIYSQIGISYFDEDNYASAEQAFTKAKDLVQSEGNSPELGESLYHLGRVHKQTKNYALAKQSLTDALNVYTELAQPDDQAHMHYQRGKIYFIEQQYPAAYTDFVTASTLYGADSELIESAEVLYHLGLTQKAQQKPGEADKYFNQSLVQYTHLDDEDSQTDMALIHYQLGLLSFEQEETDTAQEHFENALAAFSEDTDHIETADTWFHLGLLYQTANPQQAITYLTRAQAQFTRYNDDEAHNLRLVQTLDLLGQIYTTQRNYEYARDFFSSALEYDIGTVAMIANIHLRLGKTYIALNQTENARASLTHAQTMYQTLNLDASAAEAQQLLTTIAAPPSPATPAPHQVAPAPQSMGSRGREMGNAVAAVPLNTTTNPNSTHSSGDLVPPSHEAQNTCAWLLSCCGLFGSSSAAPEMQRPLLKTSGSPESYGTSNAMGNGGGGKR